MLVQSVGVDNLVRLTIPAAPVTLSTVTAAATTHVRAGSNSNTAYSSLAATCVGSNSGTHTNTYASVMRFTVTNPSTITSAVLRLTVSSLSASLTANMPMLLLAIPDNGWTPATATWTSLTGGSQPLDGLQLLFTAPACQGLCIACLGVAVLRRIQCLQYLRQHACWL